MQDETKVWLHVIKKAGAKTVRDSEIYFHLLLTCVK